MDPDDVVDGIDILEEGGDALEAVGEFGAHGVEIDAAALLEVGELGDLQTVEHDLPADAPGGKRGRFPVVLFKLDVVAGEVDADGLEGLEVELLHVLRRRLEDDLELSVLVEAVGILAITSVGGTARGLHVGDTVRLGSEDAEKSFRRHGSGADFDIERLLQDAALAGPEILQLEDEFLKRKRLHSHE